ncbi:MAG: hypothetical protein ACREQZ_02105 [Woeseiaceae bacterium]
MRELIIRIAAVIAFSALTGCSASTLNAVNQGMMDAQSSNQRILDEIERSRRP